MWNMLFRAPEFKIGLVNANMYELIYYKVTICQRWTWWYVSHNQDSDALSEYKYLCELILQLTGLLSIWKCLGSIRYPLNEYTTSTKNVDWLQTLSRRHQHGLPVTPFGDIPSICPSGKYTNSSYYKEWDQKYLFVPCLYFLCKSSSVFVRKTAMIWTNELTQLYVTLWYMNNVHILWFNWFNIFCWINNVYNRLIEFYALKIYLCIVVRYVERSTRRWFTSPNW